MTSPDLPPASPRSTVSGAGRYGRALARQWPVVLVAMVLGALVATQVPSLKSNSYTSTAVVEVRPRLQSLSTVVSDSSSPNMITEQAVARASVVVDETLRRWQTDLTTSQFQSRATATSPNKSTTLSLSFTGRSPGEAQQGAQVWADTYLGLRRQAATDELEGATKRASDSVGLLQSKLTLAESVAQAARAGTPEAQRADEDVRLLNTQLAPVRARLDALSSMDVSAGRLISAPGLPRTTDGLPGSLVLLAGGVIGLLLGVALGLLVERVWGRTRQAADVRGAVSVPVWAAPRGKRGKLAEGRHDPSLAVVAALLGKLDTRPGQTVVLADCFGSLAPQSVAELRAALDERDSRLPADRRPTDRPVLLAAPGLLDDPESVATTVGADLVLLLVESGRTQLRHLRSAVSTLEEAGAGLDGVVLLHRRPRSASGAPATAGSAALPTQSLRPEHATFLPEDERAGVRP